MADKVDTEKKDDEIEREKQKLLQSAQKKTEGHGNGVMDDAQFVSKEKFNWSSFIDEGIWGPLQKIKGEKDVADMAFDLFLAVALEMPTKMLDNWVKQSREIRKANLKNFENNKNSAIDANLSRHGLDRNAMVSKLAHDAKEWILNTSIPSYAFGKAEGFYLKKSEFVSGLPRKADGDLDFDKFSKKQTKGYAAYVLTYAFSPMWHKEVAEKMGVYLSRADLKQQAMRAAGLKVPGMPLTPEEKRALLAARAGQANGRE